MRSLPKNFEKLELQISQLSAQPDIILLSETWLDPSLAASYNLSSYNLEVSSPESFRGKGCGIYINNSIVYKRRQDLESSELKFQSVFIEICIPNKKNIVLASIYRSPSFPVTDFLEYFEPTMLRVNLESKYCIIGGDFNVDLLKHQSMEIPATFLNTFLALGLVPTISVPTRVCNESKSLIDNFFLNEVSLIKSSNVIISDISDHLPIHITLGLPNPNSRSRKTTQIFGFDFRKIEQLKTSLCRKLQDITDIVNPNLAMEFLSNNITTEIMHFSIRKDRKSVPVQPWISFDLLRSINIKKDLHKKSIQNPSQENRQNFIAFRNRLCSQIRAAKKQFFERKLEEYKSHPTKIWKILAQLVRKNKSKSNLPDKFMADGVLLTNPVDISSKFNNFFGSIASTLDSKLESSNIDPLSYLEDHQPPAARFELVPTNVPTILSIIQNLDPNSAVSDCITPKILKAISVTVAPYLNHAFNLCLTEGVFPSILKKAVVIPIHKSGDKFTFNNYRPISLLSILSKVLEKIIYYQLSSFINTENILYDNQFGFRQHHSSYMPVSLLQEHITSALERKEISAAIYLDYAKAFDTVNHHILLKKLEKYGCNDVALSLFQSYLLNRTQLVKYNDTLSPTAQTITHGVPQGSILGPLLFLIYINDLHLTCPGTYFQFADDTVVVFTEKDHGRLQNTIALNLPKLELWLTSNRITLNAKKTTYQLFTNQIETPTLNIKIKNEVIKRQSATKYLGIWIDDKFKWNTQIRTVENSVSQKIGMIGRAKPFLKNNHLLLLYNSLVLPHFLYGIQAWGVTYETKLNKLKVLQKKIVRIIDSADFLAPSSPIFKKYNILKLPDLIKLHQMSVLHSFLNHTLPNPLARKFTLGAQTRNRTARQAKHFEVPFAAYNYRTFSIFISAPKIWNANLAPKIRNIEDIPRSKVAFKKVVKKMFLDGY